MGKVGNQITKRKIKRLDVGVIINDVSSKGEGVKNVGIFLEKRQQRGKDGGHEIGKMG